MAEFRGPAIDRRRNQGQGREEFGVTVALHNLRRDRCWTQSKLLTNFTLDPRIKMRMGSNRAAQFSHANTLARLCEAFFGAPEFVEHQGELQTKRDRLGMNAVTSSDHGRPFIFARLFADDFSQCGQII